MSLSEIASKSVENVVKFSALGFLADSVKKEEKFEDQKQELGTTGKILVIVFVVLIAVIIPYASYNIMGKSILHAVLAFFFGILYIFLVWLWAGLFANRQLK